MNAPLPAESKYKAYQRTRPVKWWHEAIIDDMLLFPLDTNAQRGARLGYTPQAIMMLINSDMFRAAYESRKSEMRSRLDDGITAKLLKTANLGLDLLHKKMEEKQTSIPFKDLVDANNSILSRLGYGVKEAPAAHANVQVNVNAGAQVSAEALAEARAKLRAVEEGRALESPAPSAHAHARPIGAEPRADAQRVASPLIDITPNSPLVGGADSSNPEA